MTKLNLKNIVYITVLLTFAFYLSSTKFPQLNFWKYSIASFAIFSIIYSLDFIYEKYFWNKHWLIKKIFTLIGFQEYPNISGKWKMKYFSSYKYDWDNSKYKFTGEGDIFIKKIYGGFAYSGKFDQSSFKSSSNYFERNRNNKEEWVLGYKYANCPEETDLHNSGFAGHFGFAMLNFDEEKCNELVGFYGNDENRKTRGKILLRRMEIK